MKKIFFICALLFLILITTACAKVFIKNNNPDKPADLNPIYVYSFSAGKADAHLIYNDKFAVLIDCGKKGFGQEILDYMEAHGLTYLDYMIITHFDKDHVGGAAKIINSIEVDNILQSNCPKYSEEYDKYNKAIEEAGITPITLREDYSFELVGAEFTVNPPLEEKYDKNSSNNSSLITSLIYGGNSFLFAGDAQDERLEEFVDSNTRLYQYLKVPYHGHWQDNLKKFIYNTGPNICVITSSDEEKEDNKTMWLLKTIGAKTYLTRESPVLVEANGSELTVTANK